MTATSKRLEREKRTIAVMITMYHRGMHTGDSLCPDCADLLAYALQRIEKCPFGADKPACANCTIHCYAGPKRERVRAVMRYAGPRMLLRHPILALLHLWDSRKRRS